MRSFATLGALALAAAANAQSISKVNSRDWAVGGNPTNLDMFYYAPPSLPANSPIVVAVRARIPFSSSFDRET